MPRVFGSELEKAVTVGSVERTVAVLARGEDDIDRAGPMGITPLMLTCASYGRSPNSRIVRILVDKGADMSPVNEKGFHALHLAVQEGHLAVFKMLLKAGADIHARTAITDCTPLDLAAEYGRTEMLSMLIEAGADPNSRAVDSSTPLYTAAGEGHLGVIKVLLRAGADPLLT